MTNNQRLKLLIADNTLTNLAVSKILDISIHTVNSWTCAPGTLSHRNMPDISMKYLELIMKSKRGGK